MKFLAVAKLREVPPVPPEQFLKIVLEDFQTIKQYQEEGKTEVGYVLAGLKGFMVVLDVESGAELNGLLAKLSLFTVLDIEIYPLMTVDEALTQVKQSLKAIKAQQ